MSSWFLTIGFAGLLTSGTNLGFCHDSNLSGGWKVMKSGTKDTVPGGFLKDSSSEVHPAKHKGVP